VGASGKDHPKDAVYKESALYDMINAMQNLEETENDLKSFNKYFLEKLEDRESDLYNAVNGIQYTYDLNMQVYTENVDGKIIHSDLEKIISELMLEYLGLDMSMMTSMSQSSTNPMASMSSMRSMGRKLWQELLPGEDGEPINDLIYEQYEKIYGSWPNSYDEVVLVVNKNNELNDISLYALGLLSEEDIDVLANAAISGTELGSKEKSWSFEEICQREYRTILNADCYHYDSTTGKYTDLRETEAGMRYLYDNAMKLKVTGIIRLKEGENAGMLKGNICYTSDLTKHLIEKAKDSEIIAAQLENDRMDIISGLPFYYNSATVSADDKEERVRNYIESLDDAGKAAFYAKAACVPTNEYVEEQLSAKLEGLTRDDMIAYIASAQGMAPEDMKATLSSVTDGNLKEMVSTIFKAQIAAEYSAKALEKIAGKDAAALLSDFEKAYKEYGEEEFIAYYDSIVIIEEKNAKFREYVATLTDAQKAELYVTINSIPSEEIVNAELQKVMAETTPEAMVEYLLKTISAQMGVSETEIGEYLNGMSAEEIAATFTYAKTEEIKLAYPQIKGAEIRATYTEQERTEMLNSAMDSYTTEQCAAFYDNAIEFSESNYEDNLKSMGYIDMDYPATMNIYASSFENKDIIVEAIDAYNDSVGDLKKIHYTDYFGILMSSITTIIDAITYVLIAFVAISLVVSSIMIGVITLISVQERTKEIGILRAIGASKRNVSRMFNAETIIVGLCAGLLGVIVTYLLCIPINMILYSLTDIANLKAVLPIGAAIILVAISVILTLISGLIPAKSAAKKDPVVALRTE